MSTSSPPSTAQRHGGVGDGVRQLLEGGAVLLPSQVEPRSDGVYGTPSGLLWAAVLEEAVHLLELTTYAKSAKGQRLHAQTKAWFLSDERGWPGSFLDLCDNLGVPADLLRRQVLHGQPVFSGRRYRTAGGSGQRRIGSR